MSRAALLALLLLLPLPAAPQPAAGVEYRLFVACPDEGDIYFSTNSRAGCPIRVVDDNDLMGAPSLAVDPIDPANVIMASLHGCVDGRGPTPKSRAPASFPACLEQFTTFTSTSAGAQWTDKPYCPSGGEDSYGEHVQATIDPYGRVYIGSLFATPMGNGSFAYDIAAQKFEDIGTVDALQGGGGSVCRAGDYNANVIAPVYASNAITNFWFVFNPQTDHMTMVWHELTGGALRNQTQSDPPEPCFLDLPSPLPCLPPPLSGLAATRLRRPDAHVSGVEVPPGTKPVGAIGVVWTNASIPMLVEGSGENGTETPSEYRSQRFEDVIQPCSAGTNPVLSDGYLYVGCVADPEAGEFRWNPSTIPGTLELFRMHPDGRDLEYLGTAPLNGGTPKLGVRSDGRMALATTQSREGRLELDIVFGRYDAEKRAIAWGERQAYGDKLVPHVPGVKVLRPNVQDLIYREYSGVVHLILRHTVQPDGIGVDAVAASIGPRIRKSIVAVDETLGILANMRIDVGNIANRTDVGLGRTPERVHEDLSDDFLQLPAAPRTITDPATGQDLHLGDTYQRQFFAIGDYGTVLFAEIIEVTDLRGPAAVPPAQAPAPVPAVASSTNLSLAPAAGIALAAVLGLSLVATRRKNPAAAIAKMKK